MDIVRVNDKRQLVEVEADKDTIKEGPTFGDDREITPEFEQRVLNYYQVETAQAAAERKAYGPYYTDATSNERVDVLPGERAGAHEHLGERQQENEVRGADRERSDLGDEELRSEEESRARGSERQSDRVNVRKRMRSDRQRREATNLPVDVPPRTDSGLSGPASASRETPTGDVPPRTAQFGETPPPRPRRATPAETAPPSEDARSEEDAPHDVSTAGEDAASSAEVPRGEIRSGSPREAPPPGEERPEKRGVVPSTDDTTPEVPPPGEERPERRTP